MIPRQLENPILITNRVNQRWLHRLPMAQGAIYLSKRKNIFFSWGRFAPENLPNGLEVKAITAEELGSYVAKLLHENHEKKNRNGPAKFDYGRGNPSDKEIGNKSQNAEKHLLPVTPVSAGR